MRLLMIFIPLLLAFNYKPSLNQWELSTKSISANELGIRSGLSKFKQQCEFEKNHGLFPLSCLKLLKSMKELNPNYDYTDIEARLDKRCLDKVDKIITLNQVNQISSNVILGSSCEQKFKKQKEIIKYKLEI